MSKDGGPAFPRRLADIDEGMTLRDWFAGQVLAGMLSGRGVFFDPVAASISYKYADAMLAERDKNK